MQELLVYTPKITPRVTYVFKHICTRILGIQVVCTTAVEEFVAFSGPKMVYGSQPSGNAFFVKNHGLLVEQGITDVTIHVKPWEETVGFFPTSDLSSLPFDIFAASFYLLSRYEEYLPHVKDSMGRYPCKESLGHSGGFLQNPVVDIWAFKFLEALRGKFPNIQANPGAFNMLNLIDISEAYKYKNKGFLRTFFGIGKDLGRFKFRSLLYRTRVLLTLSKDPNDTFDWIVEIGKKFKVPYSVFFQIGDYSQYDYNISQHKKQYRSLIKSMADYAPVGLRISHRSLEDFAQLKEEKRRLEAIVNRPITASINASGILNMPEILRQLIDLEITENYSMGYATSVGFRAGTCRPFYFYDLDFEVQTPLKFVPYAISLEALKGQTQEELLETVAALKDQVKLVHGQLVVVYNNHDFALSLDNRSWRPLYTELIQDEPQG